MFGPSLANLRFRTTELPMASDDPAVLYHHWMDTQPMGTVTAYTDGAVNFPAMPDARHGGWAVVWLRNNGSLCRAAWGALSLTDCPKQTSFDAELVALSVANQLCEGSTYIVTDSQAALDLFAQGLARATGASQSRAHLMRVHYCDYRLDDRELYKITSHMSYLEAQQQNVHVVHWLGNGCADALASLAASLHPMARHAQLRLDVHRKLVELALWAAVQVEQVLTGEIRDHVGLPESTGQSVQPTPPGSQPAKKAQRRWIAPTWLSDLVELAREDVEGFLSGVRRSNVTQQKVASTQGPE
eukprot:4657244-Amphidinium_carterae.1